MNYSYIVFVFVHESDVAPFIIIVPKFLNWKLGKGNIRGSKRLDPVGRRILHRSEENSAQETMHGNGLLLLYERFACTR